MAIINLTGQRYGMLTVIREVPKNKRHESKWLCKCDCGNLAIKTTGHLRRKCRPTKSCGCLIKTNFKPVVIDGVNYNVINGKIYKNNTTGIKGVYWRKDTGKYRAAIGYKSRLIHLGCSEDIDVCATARKMAVDAVNDGTFEDFYYALKGKPFEGG